MPYQNCTILENSCLDKLIRIENPCEATQPTKHNGTVFFPNKLVPEFTWQNAAKVKSEFAKGYDFAVNLKAATLDSIVMDVRQMLLENKFEFTVADTAKANIQTIDVTTCPTIPTVTGSQAYRGVSIMLRQLKGTLKTIAGIPGTKGKIDGSALTATFNCPASVLVSDKVYIADEQNHLIRTITVNK